VKEVDIDERREDLLPFMRGHLPAHDTDEHFEWLYRSNPFGKARAWIATEESDDGIVGAAAAFPRRMIVQGRELTGWNLGDFAIGRHHRSLGPALQLQRACLEPVLCGEIPFAYDHPSCNMMAIYRWMKIPATGKVVRYALPLRVDDKVRSLIGDRLVSRAVSKVGNVLLELRRGARDKGSPFVVRTLDERFDERATELQGRLAREYTVSGARTAEYLNWRYLDNPHRRYEALMVEDDGRLRGYALFCRDGDMAFLADLFAEPDPTVQDALLAGVIRSLGDGPVQTLSAPVLEAAPLRPLLQRWGFQARESATFVVCTQSGGPLDGVVTQATNWFHTNGDRDV
jgi:hypothetical protein